MPNYSKEHASLIKLITCMICIVALGSLIAISSVVCFASADESWADDLDCSLCHTEEVEEIEQTTHVVVDCTICHDDEETLTEIHEEVDDDTALPTRLKKTSVDDSICLECHGDDGIAAPSVNTEDEDIDAVEEITDLRDEGDAADATDEAAEDAIETANNTKDDTNADEAEEVEEADAVEDTDDEEDADDEEEALPEKTQLIAATADSEVLTDSRGTVVNPHDLPDTTNHNKIACVDCHKIHDAETDVAATASKKCINCHHENVYECYTCHS